jgi:hypothetical protein
MGSAAVVDAVTYANNGVNNDEDDDNDRHQPSSTATKATTIIHAQQPKQTDMMTMNVSKIKRELNLYGIAMNDTKPLRQDWES